MVQTNNATFGYTDESVQQLAMSRLRAVEHGRAVVHVSTVGVSALITPDGQLQRSSRLFTADVLEGRLPLRTGITPATRLGALPELVLAGLGLVLAAAGAVRARRSRRDRERDERDRAGAGGRAHVQRAENLPLIVGRLRAAVPAADVLVADDASPDGTGQLADGMAADDEQVHVLHRPAKRGLGAAYLDAFGWGLARGYDVLVEMDADGSHAPEQLPRLLERSLPAPTWSSARAGCPAGGC